MDLYNIVYQLVQENDCVIIPGFGGFVTNCFSAEIDFSRQEFCPPSRKVAFNENLSLSDGLLVNYVSQTEKLSWQDADEAVRAFAAELNQKLSENQTVAFEGLGDFSRKTGNLVFSPCAANLLDDAFGLPTFNFPMLHSSSKLSVEKTVIKVADDNRGNHKRGKIIAWSLSSAAVIGVLICLTLHFGWLDGIMNSNGVNTILAGFGFGNKTEQVVNEQKDEKIENPVVDTTANIVIDESEPESEDIVEESVEEEESIDEEVAEKAVEEVVAVTETVEYKTHIIAGCFSELTNAENSCKNLQSKGLPAQILPLHKGLYRVSVKGFASTKEACAELKNLKEISGNSSLWILNL